MTGGGRRVVRQCPDFNTSVPAPMAMTNSHTVAKAYTVERMMGASKPMKKKKKKKRVARKDLDRDATGSEASGSEDKLSQADKLKANNSAGRSDCYMYSQRCACDTLSRLFRTSHSLTGPWQQALVESLGGGKH